MITFLLVFSFLAGCAFLSGVLIALGFIVVAQVRRMLRGER